MKRNKLFTNGCDDFKFEVCSYCMLRLSNMRSSSLWFLATEAYLEEKDIMLRSGKFSKR